MSKWKKGKPRRTGWQPLQPATRIPPSPEKVEAMRVHAVELGLDPGKVDQILSEQGEMFQNDLYTVIVSREPNEGWVTRLSIRRNDRGVEFPWRHLQRIKSELAGDEVEAIELFPAESRLIDTANQRWLWCLPPGSKLPVGFDEGRHVAGPSDSLNRSGARQAPLPK